LEYYVFFIQEAPLKGEKIAPFKIGMATDVERRLDEMQVGNPRKLRIRASIKLEDQKQAQTMERCLHHLAEKKFKRVRGEWFRLYGDIKTLMAEAAKMGHIEEWQMLRHKDPDKEKDRRIRELEAEVARLRSGQE
jgi:hypothetical protein